jgi:hypothetical protein
MIRDKQLKTFEELVMFEQRILSHILPQDFDKMEYLIASDMYRPPINDSIAIAFNKKRSKILQEAKRTILNMFVHAYEMKIQEYEQQYRRELSAFTEYVTNDTLPIGTCSQDTITVYINHRRNRIKQEVYHKISSLRKQLRRRRQRSSASTKNIVDVCPQVILDVDHVPLNAAELKYLSKGKLVFSFIV